MKVDWNLSIPQNMENFLAGSSNKWQLTDLFTQKLLIDGIHVKQATGDAGMLLVKKALVRTEEFDSAVVYSRYTDTFVPLLHRLDGDIHKNVIMETKKGCFHLKSCANTVSVTYGLGKLRAYKKLHESNSW